MSRVTEQRLLEAIGRLDFGSVRMHGVVARRRVVQFGWRYSFDARALTQGAPLPEPFAFLQERVATLLRLPSPDLSEVLVTEYTPGATIGWHRDAPPFGIVAGVSLGSSCRMRLRRESPTGWDRVDQPLEPRSVYVLRDEARSDWQHSIPAVETLRYSITFRTVGARPRAPRTPAG